MVFRVRHVADILPDAYFMSSTILSFFPECKWISNLCPLASLYTLHFTLYTCFMTLHQNIKEQIKDALRARDTIRLDTLRGLASLMQNEVMAGKATGEFLSDEAVLALVKRSAKQRKDSIEQFEKGGRADLATKEKAELKILESFLPTLMSRKEIHVVARTRIEALKSQPWFDPKSSGRIVGVIMKELAGKADGADVKAVVEEILQTP